MSEANGSHPAWDVLSRFALGKLDEDQIVAVAGHLSDCAACRDAAASATDELVDLLRAEPSGTDGSGDLPPVLRNHSSYCVLRTLGRGGMGSVYLARHRTTGERRAIKVINPALIADARAAKRFEYEADLLSKLRHPNIVRADAERIDGQYLVVMDVVEGETLEERIHRQGPLLIEVACEFARQVALGLQYAHEQGLVHRDIKPANLMVTSDGQVKILDFGLARMVGDTQSGTGLTHEHASLGTPDYSAPEQSLDARNADICSDIYSLGCTLVYLLTGKPPFQGQSAQAVFLAHLQEPLMPLHESRPDAPAALCELIGKMLAKLPDQRPQTPAEVAECLLQILGEADRPAQGEGGAKDRGVPPKKRLIRWGAGALVLALVAALVFWGLKVHHARTLNVHADWRADVLKGAWTIDGSELIQSAREKQALLLIGPSDLSHYNFSFRARREEGEHGFKAVFHYLSENHLCQFAVGNYVNRAHDLSYVFDGVWGRKIGMEEPGHIELNRWYEVRVEVRGSDFRCFLDGRQVFQYRDERFKHGRIGLAVWNAKARFRDLRVTTPEGKVLWAGPPELPK